MEERLMKKALSLFLTLLMVVALFASCSSTATESTPAPTDDTQSEDTQSSSAETTGTEKIELDMWGGWSGDQVAQLEEQLQGFNDSQDMYTVKYMVQDAMEEKLLTAFAGGGDIPDVLLWDRYNTGIYASRGALDPIDDLIERDSLDLGQFFAPSVDEMNYEGEQYGLPLLVDARILFYNKTMFEEAGVDPDTIKTWDDLETAAIALTKRNGDVLEQAGMSLKDVGLFNIWITQAGGELVDGSVTPAKTAFNSDAGLSVLNYWDTLLNEHKVYEIGFEDGFGGNGFKAGKVAITYDGPWALADYTNAGIDYGVIANPTGPNGDQGAFMGGFGLAMPKDGENRDAAWEFIKWWTTIPENGVKFAQISGWIPANLDATNDPYFTENEYYKVFVEVMSYASIRPKVGGYSDVEGLALIPQLQLWQSGEITAQEALDAAQSQGDQIFADNE